MGQTATRPWYDWLNDSQKKELNAIRGRTDSSGRELLDAHSGDQVIEILESWLMDDEQKQHLQANSWDIFFLYAAASLLYFQNTDVANSPAGIASPENTSENNRPPEPAKSLWQSLDICDRQQTDILTLIGQGYLAASTMADEIPPRVAYDGDKTVNIQFRSRSDHVS